MTTPAAHVGRETLFTPRDTVLLAHRLPRNRAEYRARREDLLDGLPLMAQPHPTKRASAIFFDDSYANFTGVSTISATPDKTPPIRTVHCPEPLTCAQMDHARMLVNSAVESGEKLFFFFDFDGTLSLKRQSAPASGANDSSGVASLHQLLHGVFGEEERQHQLATLLATLLAAEQCYVLTANQNYRSIAKLLNLLLDRGGHVPARFTADSTILYTPTGTKVNTIRSLVAARGYKLVTSTPSGCRSHPPRPAIGDEAATGRGSRAS